nr:threonine/serine exporter family protein [Bradyrhizobium erythrophlei]
MDIEERSRFVLTAAKGLFVNGESTEQTVTAAARLADVLGLRAKLSVRWDELALQVDSANGALLRLEAAEPTGVEMDRVASVMRVIDELAAGDLKPEEARAEIETASHARPAPTWLFAIAAAAGATALSVIFGVDNFPAAAVIAGSAGMGACCAVSWRALVRTSSCIPSARPFSPESSVRWRSVPSSVRRCGSWQSAPA